MSEDKKETVNIILNNNKNYVNRNNKFITVQVIVGFKKLFYSYIIKDWLLDQNDNAKVCEYNQIIVKLVVKFYYQY